MDVLGHYIVPPGRICRVGLNGLHWPYNVARWKVTWLLGGQLVLAARLFGRCFPENGMNKFNDFSLIAWALLGGAILFQSQLLGADNWPDYRGPTADGHTDATALPLTWSESKNVKWKTAIHGRAWSSPVIWGEQIWLTTATKDGKRLSVLCVNKKDGKILLDKVLFTVVKPQFCHSYNSYASPSPIIEEGRVYVTWGSPGTACIDTKSLKVVWKRDDLKCNHFRAPGSSPVIYKDKLILTHDGSDFQYVIALSKKSGKTIWKTDRSTDFNDLVNGKPKRDGDERKGFSTPYFITVNGNVQMISPGAKAAFAYDPETGKEIWTVRYPEHSSASRTMFGHGLLFINSGFGKAQLMAVKPDGKGDVTKTHVVWAIKKAVPKKPTGVLVGDLIYSCDDGGMGLCIDAKTGKAIWTERIGGKHSAAALYSKGRVYFADENTGTTTVIEPGREFKVLAKNKLDKGCMGSPAVSGNALFLRTLTHLYRIEE
jgi:outer membrane protein assembly factor BamB